MSKFSKFYLPALAAGVLAATATASAMAGTGDLWVAMAPSVTVHYSDLDLTTNGGRAKLYQRLTSAASHVCPGAMEVGYMTASHECQVAAVRRAVHDIGGTFEAQLTAEHWNVQARNMPSN
jgi:UrcA family protein